ncbi:MAG: hypothetical protein F4121_09210 [Acidimicrobiia bacterium]|nr:hypothetical protein [Acidimicrobiia bacterium]MYI20227.1 hypothetical protein [Acidimicrobiia bacterium]
MVLLPATIMLVLVLALHAFIVVNARAEASLAASEGLRAVWRMAADSNLSVNAQLTSEQLENEGALLAEAAEAAVSRVSGDESGWRWWTDGGAEVYSDWCGGTRPDPGSIGWARVVVSGDIIGPLSWFWPERSHTAYATAEGPVLFSPQGEQHEAQWESVPAQWSRTDLSRC